MGVHIIFLAVNCNALSARDSSVAGGVTMNWYSIILFQKRRLCVLDVGIALTFSHSQHRVFSVSTRLERSHVRFADLWPTFLKTRNRSTTASSVTRAMWASKNSHTTAQLVIRV